MPNPTVSQDLERIYSTVSRRAWPQNSTVVITGCGGFLGYYLAQFLVSYAQRLGIQKVIGLDTFLLGKPKWLKLLAEGFPSVLDLRQFDVSRDDISAVPGAEKANLVVHAASIASPTFYRQYPVETIDANVWGLRRLLDFYRHTGTLKGMLFFSSSEIYGDPQSQFIPTDEEFRGNVSCHGPRACYDEAKRFGETLCWVYAQQFRMPITVARPFNNYGPGMRLEDRRLPADFAKAVVEGRDIIILSDGTPTRTFCYVSDAITGYLLCLVHGKYDYFNIGIEKPEIMVKDLARIYQEAGREIFGYTGKVLFKESEDPQYLTDNPNRRCPVIAKARQTLGYDPQVSVEEGVGRYLRFLKCEGLS